MTALRPCVRSLTQASDVRSVDDRTSDLLGAIIGRLHQSWIYIHAAQTVRSVG